MTPLADAVLPLVRTRRDLHRWSAANEHGEQMHRAIDLLEDGLPSTDPTEAYAVVDAALASPVKVIARADDSSGIVGGACHRLLTLHPQGGCRRGGRPDRVGRLDDHVPVPRGRRLLRDRPDRPRPRARRRGHARVLEAPRRGAGHARTRTAGVGALVRSRSSRALGLEWNDRRLAVFDRDVDAIISTHARDRKVAAWLRDTAEALDEIGESDLAIDWARQATELGPWRVDPLAVLPTHRRLVEHELVNTGAKHYRLADRPGGRGRRADRRAARRPPPASATPA